MKRGNLVGSLSGPNFAIRTAKMNSLICVLENVLKRKQFNVKEKSFLMSDQRFWQKFYENGVITGTDFLLL